MRNKATNGQQVDTDNISIDIQVPSKIIYVPPTPSTPPQKTQSYFLISTFILLNVYKPLALLLLGAISISGLDRSLSKYILYSLLSFFTLLSYIMIPAIFLKIKQPPNIWTAIVFCEIVKENKTSGLVGVIYSLVLIIINIREWLDCQATGFNSVLSETCNRFSTTSGFASALLVSFIGLVQYITYKGSYRISIPLSDKSMTKMKLPKIAGIPAFWLDSGTLLNSIRTICLIHSQNKYKSREQLKLAYPDLQWNILDDFKDDELEGLLKFFVSDNESIVALKKEEEIKKFLTEQFHTIVKDNNREVLEYDKGFEILKAVSKAYLINLPDLLDYCQVSGSSSILRPMYKIGYRCAQKRICCWLKSIDAAETSKKFARSYLFGRMTLLRKGDYIELNEAYRVVKEHLESTDLPAPTIFEFLLGKKRGNSTLDLKKFLSISWKAIVIACQKKALGDIVK